MKPVSAVFGAYEHAARFVTAELLIRGWTPVLSGRDAPKLGELAAADPGVETRNAAVESTSGPRSAIMI